MIGRDWGRDRTDGQMERQTDGQGGNGKRREWAWRTDRMITMCGGGRGPLGCSPPLPYQWVGATEVDLLAPRGNSWRVGSANV